MLQCKAYFKVIACFLLRMYEAFALISLIVTFVDCIYVLNAPTWKWNFNVLLLLVVVDFRLHVMHQPWCSKYAVDIIKCYRALNLIYYCLYIQGLHKVVNSSSVQTLLFGFVFVEFDYQYVVWHIDIYIYIVRKLNLSYIPEWTSFCKILWFWNIMVLANCWWFVTSTTIFFKIYE